MLGLVYKTDSESNSLIGIGRKETFECVCLNTVQLKPFVISLKYLYTTIAWMIITAHKRSCGKVMFSQASVCSPVGGGCSYVTIIHDAFDLTVLTPPAPDMDLGAYPQAPPPRHGTCVPTPLLRPTARYWHLVVHHWRPVQNCSLEDPHPTHTHQF